MVQDITRLNIPMPKPEASSPKLKVAEIHDAASSGDTGRALCLLSQLYGGLVDDDVLFGCAWSEVPDPSLNVFGFTYAYEYASAEDSAELVGCDYEPILYAMARLKEMQGCWKDVKSLLEKLMHSTDQMIRRIATYRMAILSEYVFKTNGRQLMYRLYLDNPNQCIYLLRLRTMMLTRTAPDFPFEELVLLFFDRAVSDETFIHEVERARNDGKPSFGSFMDILSEIIAKS